MRYDKNTLFITVLYLLAMLAICTYTVTSVKSIGEENASTDSSSASVEYVYVTVPYPSETTEKDSVDEEYWRICEYEGKVGVFLSDGTLYEVLDVYVKTLPEADRRMLGEGIIIKNEGDLISIIEDYTS